MVLLDIYAAYVRFNFCVLSIVSLGVCVCVRVVCTMGLSSK